MIAAHDSPPLGGLRAFEKVAQQWTAVFLLTPASFYGDLKLAKY